MKKYNVIIANDQEIVSQFQINASNLIEAKRNAQFLKRRIDGSNNCRTSVRLYR